MSEDKGVLFLVEGRDGGIAPVTAELITAGRKIAHELGDDLAALVVGADMQECARLVAQMGVKKVYVVDDPVLSSYVPELYEAVVTHACAELRPRVLLLGHTEIGRDLAPRLASRMDVGLAPNCVDIGIDPESGTIQATRPVFGGKALGLFAFEAARPAVATIGRKVFEPASVGDGARGEVIPFQHVADTGGVRASIIERVVESEQQTKLEEAEVVVSGGRGMGDEGGFSRLGELAAALGASVGSSRPPVDNGWVPSNLQVGLTGTVVSPKLYLAIGISGAAQHMAGCISAKTIVAINRDAEAPIFQRAHFGAVADWREILPLLIEKCTGVTG